MSFNRRETQRDNARTSIPGWGRTAAYAAPIVGSFFFYAPMWSIVPGIYAKYFGLSLAAIGTALLAIRVFDGILDVLIGYVSDWRRARGGSRKPWVVVGGSGAIFACYFLFQPPEQVGINYYVLWSLIYFTAFTLSEIPHVTWGSELTLDYHGRAKVFGIRNIAIRLGSMLFYGLPLLPLYATSDFTPEVLQDAAWIGSALMLAGLLWMSIAAPAGVPPRHSAHRDSFKQLASSVGCNRPLLLYLAAFISVGIAGGIWTAMIFFFLATYLGLGAHVAIFFLVASALAALTTPFWLAVIRRTSKKTVWLAGLGIFSVQALASYFLTPGTGPAIAFLLVFAVQIFFVCHDTAANSMLGDIIDYGKLKFSRDRGATYFGLNTLIFKVSVGIGSGLGLGLAGAFGFDATQAEQSARAVQGFHLAFVLLPLVFAGIGAAFIAMTPISPHRHAIIRRRLERRFLPAIDPASSGTNH